MNVSPAGERFSKTIRTWQIHRTAGLAEEGSAVSVPRHFPSAYGKKPAGYTACTYPIQSYTIFEVPWQKETLLEYPITVVGAAVPRCEQMLGFLIPRLLDGIHPFHRV